MTHYAELMILLNKYANAVSDHTEARCQERWTAASNYRDKERELREELNFYLGELTSRVNSQMRQIREQGEIISRLRDGKEWGEE